MWLIGLIIYSAVGALEFFINRPLVLIGLIIVALVIGFVGPVIGQLVLIMILGFALFYLLFNMLGFK